MSRIDCKCKKVTEGQAHNHITSSAPLLSRGTSVCVCVLVFSSVPGPPPPRTVNEKLSQEEDPPLFWEGINRIPIKRCTIWNMREISSNQITGIKMDEKGRTKWAGGRL